jgi:tetratricopeptide (TPR) repeat protein
LQDICELSRSEAFSGRIRPIASPTLSQLENGISMPTIESLHTLAAVYRVSAQRFLNLIAEERLANAVELPETEVMTEHAFLRMFGEGRYFDALALSLNGVRLARALPRETVWRMYQARALQMLGMVDEAVLILIAATDDERLSTEQAAAAHVELGEALLRAGNLNGAALHSRMAVEGLDASVPVGLRCTILQLRVRTVLARHQEGRSSNEQELREAQRLAQECRRLDPTPSCALVQDLHVAMAAFFLGNAAVALKDLALVLKAARQHGLLALQMEAYIWTGLVHAGRGRVSDAIAALERAEPIAAEIGDADACFDIHFELSHLFTDQPDKASFHRRKCERYLPLVSARTGKVKRFEESVRGSR